MSTASLFIGHSLIGPQEAPQRVLESSDTGSMSHYRATLRKRIGSIQAVDFLNESRRFVDLCAVGYGGVDLRLYAYATVDFRMDRELVKISRDGTCVYTVKLPSAQFDLEQLTEDSFAELFRGANQVRLVIRPPDWLRDALDAVAYVEWRSDNSQEITFRAMHEEGYTVIERSPIIDLLLRKMFHVRGTPPNLSYTVDFGKLTFQEKTDPHYGY